MIENFMLAALDISQNALPDCLPNPPVGCVIVKNGEIVATGHTRQPGHYHAEADALSRYVNDLSECEIYVTLEPCSFAGRTPSCAQALARLKPKKVYVGMLDSDPRNQGAGIEVLRSAGIDVEVGLAARFVSEWLRPFLIKAI